MIVKSLYFLLFLSQVFNLGLDYQIWLLAKMPKEVQAKESVIGAKVHSGILITKDKHKIAYRHYVQGFDKVIIIAHGFYNSKEAVVLQQLAKSLIDTYDVFMFDFRGHGKSNGLFSWMSKEGEDLKTVIEYLDDRYARKGIIGFSLGGGISINVLAKYPKADSLICVSIPTEFKKIDYHFWKLDWEGDFVYTLFSSEGKQGKGVRPGWPWLKKDKPIDNVSKITTIPILYIHGEKDWVIKPWHSQTLYDKTVSKKKLVIIENGPHAEYLARDYWEEFAAEIKTWFKETLLEEDM